jgi:hypothetical protein
LKRGLSEKGKALGGHCKWSEGCQIGLGQETWMSEDLGILLVLSPQQELSKPLGTHPLGWTLRGARECW